MTCGLHFKWLIRLLGRALVFLLCFDPSLEATDESQKR